MKKKQLYLFSISLLILLLTCCEKKYPNVNEPDNPRFRAMLLKADKNNPALSKASFKLVYDEASGDSIIQNLDSLPYQTRIDSVIPLIRFESSSKVVFYQDEDSTVVQESDTVGFINFTKKIKVRNYSINKKKNSFYHVRINVHQVDPDLYQWNQLSKEISSSVQKNQKALLFKDEYLFFFSDESKISLFSSKNATEWSEETIHPTLSGKFILRSITEYNEKLYLVAEDGRLYNSSDAKQWQEISYSASEYKIKNILYPFDGKIWALAESADKYYFVGSSDGVSWELNEKDTVPSNFPVADYSSLIFKSPVGNSKVIVLGGKNKSGELIKERFFTKSDPTTRWFAVEGGGSKDVLALSENPALVQYDNRLVLFGGKNNKDEIVGVLESYDEGLNWKTPDSVQMSLPLDWEARHQSIAFVNEEEKRIYIFGGQNDSKAFSDVWGVKLNRIDFIKKSNR